MAGGWRAAARAVTVARLARYPEEKARAASAPPKAASALSSAVWSVVLPVTRRDPVAPVPHRRVASVAASTTAGFVDMPR